MSAEWYADVLSSVALLVALASAWFSFVQARIARQKRREELAAREPFVEPEIRPLDAPGWFKLDLHIRNRLGTAIVCERLTLRAPHEAAMRLDERVAPFSTAYLIDQTQKPAPDPAGLARYIALDLTLGPLGAFARRGERDWMADAAHVELLVRVPTRPATASCPTVLRMSLSVRLSNESESFAATIVETKLPQAAASTTS